MDNRNLQGMLLTTLGGICWGISGSIGQYLFSVEGMDAHWLVPIRLGCAGIILLLYSLLRVQSILSPWKNRQEAVELVVYGLLGVSFCQYLYFRTIQLSTAGVATILQDLSPIFILCITCYVQRRGPKFLEILSILLALVGVSLITTHGDWMSLIGNDSGSSGGVSMAALITGILSAFTVVIYNLAPVRIMRKYSIFMLQGWAFLMGGVFLSIAFHIWTYRYVPGFFGFLGIIGVVLIGNVLAFPLYMSGVRLIGADRGILYGFSEPISAALIGTLCLHTPFTLYDGIGFLCVFLMLALISVNGQREEKRKAEERYGKEK
jgi:drug/metabolite transporter (DMT)-like permease